MNILSAIKNPQVLIIGSGYQAFAFAYMLLYGVKSDEFGLDILNKTKCKLCDECCCVNWEHYWDY